MVFSLFLFHLYYDRVRMLFCCRVYITRFDVLYAMPSINKLWKNPLQGKSFLLFSYYFLKISSIHNYKVYMDYKVQRGVEWQLSAAPEVHRTYVLYSVRNGGFLIGFYWRMPSTAPVHLSISITRPITLTCMQVLQKI